MSDTARQLNVTFTEDNVKQFGSSGFFWATISVRSRGVLLDNVIWQNRSLSPEIDLAWNAEYALNWTLDDPPPSGKLASSLTLKGSWKKVGFGQAVELGQDGFFTDPSASADADFITISKNNMKSTTTPGVRIVLGIQNSQSGFDPIFMDPEWLEWNISAKYKPVELLKWGAAAQSALPNDAFLNMKPDPAVVDYSAPDSSTGNVSNSKTTSLVNGVWVTKAK